MQSLLFHGDWPNLPYMKDKRVVCIGRFDGVHLGHQQLLMHAQKIAQSLGCGVTVLFFDPHPMQLLAGNAPEMLTNVQQRTVLLKHYGADQVVCLNFNQALAHLSAADFLQEVLLNRLNVVGVVVGQDFRFGCGRQGDAEYLMQWTKQQKIKLRLVEPYLHQGRRISSSWCRALQSAKSQQRLRELIGRDNILL